MAKRNLRGGKGLGARMDHSHNTGSAGGGKSVFNWGALEGDVKFFEPKEGKNQINIIPFEVRTKNHPLVRTGEMEIGDLDYVMDVYIHRFIGPNGVDVLCPKKTYNKPCPICDYMDELKTKGKKEEREKLYPQRRFFYNVVDVKNPGKGIQVFEASYKFFEKKLIGAARDEDNMTGGTPVEFAHPDNGKVIQFRGESDKYTSPEGKSYEFLTYESFRFLDRDEPVTDDQLESAVSFDELLKVMSAEDIEKVMWGEDEETTAPADDEKPAKDKPGKKAADDDEEPPAKKGKAAADDDDSPPPPKSTKADKACPHGHTFGKDNDEFKECDKCTIWSECVKAGRVKK